MSQSEKTVVLGQQSPGFIGKIVEIKLPPEVLSRYLELGILEGRSVEVLHEAPFFRDPIAIRVGEIVLAIRRQDAELIFVEGDSAKLVKFSS